MDVEIQPGNPERRLRVDVAARAQAVDDHQRRARGRLLQEHGRRRDVHEDRDRAAGRADRQGQPRGDRGEPGSHLRADRGEAGRRLLSVGRRGADVDAGATRSRRWCSGRSTTRRSAPIRRMPTSSMPAPKGSSSRRMAARRSRRCARRTATTTTSGSIRRTATHGSGERRRRERLVRRRPHVVDADEPADGGDLRRLDGQPVPVQALRRAAGQQHAHHAEPRPIRTTREDWRGGPGLRDRADHAAPARSRHRLRLVQGPVRA